MKSYALRLQGEQAVLEALDAPVPEPGPGQVLVKMHAAGLNRGEFIAGVLVKGGAPKPAGMEGAGEIVALGAGVTGAHVGHLLLEGITAGRAFDRYFELHGWIWRRGRGTLIRSQYDPNLGGIYE